MTLQELADSTRRLLDLGANPDATVVVHPRSKRVQNPAKYVTAGLSVNNPATMATASTVHLNAWKQED